LDFDERAAREVDTGFQSAVKEHRSQSDEEDDRRRGHCLAPEAYKINVGCPKELHFRFPCN
jgi:hypothetical protein